MNARACPRLFEVEALRDGRLAGSERDDFQRHLAKCAACTLEASELERLGEALRTSRTGPTDELHVRREKTRLLSAFDRTLLRENRPWLSRRLVLALGGASVIVALALFLVRRQRASEPRVASTVIDAASGSAWSRRTEARRDLVFLERGSLRVQVSHSNESVPLLVVLPDGELEDIGTTFSVSAESGRTTRVTVEEGSVLLRLRGEAPVAIGAGKEWQRTPTPSTSAHVDFRPESSVESVAPQAPTPSPSASTSEKRHDAADEFKKAVGMLNAGESARAADQFARFVERHPRDPRVQDAMYMRILALQAAGDSVRMKAAAAEYLHVHPKGFRRAEVEQLSQPKP